MAMIKSLLDEDLYKLTMQQAILFGRFAGISYQGVDCEYLFINRGGNEFPGGFKDQLRDAVDKMAMLALTYQEQQFLRGLRYLKRAYIDFLAGYRFDPNEVYITQQGGELHVRIKGPWYRTVLWEVPLMALISELHFEMTGAKADPDYLNRAVKKADALRQAGCKVADFGTRRRFSFEVQDRVVEVMKAGLPTFTGTSNVYLAMKHGITPIGTHAHEWFMAHAALFGFQQANRFALEAWTDEFDGDLGHALSDTFTSKVFFEQFGMDLSKMFDGVRQDSGDPLIFAEMAIDHYKKLRINPQFKTIIFSDGLDVNSAIVIQNYCQGRIGCAFGIGTNFTNDVGVKPLNMVIKMISCNGIPTVKLSDVPGKHTGDPKTAEICKFQLGIR